MADAQEVIDSARAILGVGVSTSTGTDPEMLRWLNLDYARLRALVAKVVPDRYTAVVTFNVSAGANTYTISPTDFETPRKVGRRSGSGAPYLPLPMLPFATAENAGDLGWRLRGNVIELFPASAAPNTAGVDNYQLTYLTKATTLEDDTTLDLPVGMERSLEMRLVARGRMRLGGEPASEAWTYAKEWEREDLLSLANAYPGAIDMAADVTGTYT